MSKSPIYSSSLKCIKVHSTFMHFNELEQIPPGLAWNPSVLYKVWVNHNWITARDGLMAYEKGNNQGIYKRFRVLWVWGHPGPNIASGDCTLNIYTRVETFFSRKGPIFTYLLMKWLSTALRRVASVWARFQANKDISVYLKWNYLLIKTLVSRVLRDSTFDSWLQLKSAFFGVSSLPA